MTTSVFDLFSIGIGPSSSHTVGPMRAAGRFAATLTDTGRLADTTRVVSELFGSLGATGHGHGSYNAVLWGLEGEDPETVDTNAGPLRAAEIRRTGRMLLAGTHPIGFDPDNDLMLYRRRSLPFHPNGMTFTAYAGSEPIARTHLLLDRRRLRPGRRRFGTPGAHSRSDAGAVPLPHRHRTAAALHRPRPLDQRRDAGQRVRTPAGGGGPGRAAGASGG